MTFKSIKNKPRIELIACPHCGRRIRLYIRNKGLFVSTEGKVYPLARP